MVGLICGSALKKDGKIILPSFWHFLQPRPPAGFFPEKIYLFGFVNE